MTEKEENDAKQGCIGCLVIIAIGVLVSIIFTTTQRTPPQTPPQTSSYSDSELKKKYNELLEHCKRIEENRQFFMKGNEELIDEKRMIREENDKIKGQIQEILNINNELKKQNEDLRKQLSELKTQDQISINKTETLPKIKDIETIYKFNKFLCQGLEALLKFKDKTDFWTYGFALNSPYRRWYDLMKTNKTITSEDIIQIAMDFCQTKGRENEYIKIMLPKVMHSIGYNDYLKHKEFRDKQKTQEKGTEK